MAKAKDYAVTSFADKGSVRLEIEGQSYEVIHYTGSFAINEIPQAVCALALGRDARDGERRAKIHSAAKGLRSMLKAKVFMTMEGEYKPDGTKWPKGEQLIFAGYFTGFGYQKIRGMGGGKVYFVAHLIHWLADLGFTSTLSSISHPSNPASLTFPSIVSPFPGGEGGGGGQGIFIAELIGHSQIMANLAAGDLWGALKGFMCSMAGWEGFNPICGKGGLGIDQIKHNTRAAKALARIEGPAGECSKGVTNVGYKYGQRLPVALSLRQGYAGIARAIGHVYSSQMVQMTAWDALVGYYLPLFGLDLCPMVDRAVVTASLPGYRGKGGKMWRTLLTNEYDFTDQSAMLPKPLKAVVVHGSIAMETRANMSEVSQSGNTCMSGVFASKAAEDGDGSIIYMPVPEWMSEISLSGLNAGRTVGNDNNKALNFNGADNGGQAPKEEPPKGTFSSAQELIDKYARTLFIQHNLRGRNGTFGGKLRLDIAPGSHLKAEGSPELFIGGEDELASDGYCQANRVTVEVNAEARRAATSIACSHLRNEAENADDRHSIDKHPIYEDAVMLGAPLLPEFDI